MAATASINRTLEKHGDELVAELREQYRGASEVGHFELESESYQIKAFAVLKSGAMLEMRPYDIDELAERFPDCHMGY